MRRHNEGTGVLTEEGGVILWSADEGPGVLTEEGGVILLWSAEYI